MKKSTKTFATLSPHQRSEIAQRSHAGRMARKQAGTTALDLAEIRQRVRDVCYQPLSDGPVADAKSKPVPDAVLRAIRRMTVQLDAGGFDDEDE